jgi:hypothetical protein
MTRKKLWNTKDIYGAKVKYKFVKLLPETMGEFHYDNNTIYIDHRIKGIQLVSTILHEEIHAILHRVGAHQVLSPDIEEIICESISTWIAENYKLKQVTPT